MKSTRDTIHDELRKRLTSGYYPPDASLVPLALSEEFAVSRTPVREALALLERDGLLVPTRRGFALRPRSDDEMLELFQIQAVLDATAAESAALRRGPVELARLDVLLEHAESLDDPAEIRRSLNDWHDTVRRAARNGTVVAFLHTLDAQVKTSAPWRTPAAPDTFTAAFAEHRTVTEAIRAQDAEAARVAMLAHHGHDRDRRIRQRVRADRTRPPERGTDS
ncbi:GntR family transcriptional regulator [Streptomyces paludis]|uniref:GntR family transcriptional regulator n=1 Tax=Streptomyces paludis TaxID=2282738 RepID=A0A345HYK0_9ACTN|nr:GntR family transcriptional regulator [Streptomyces paludis]AXG81774.1 GntR family transcriptional regulator [Streptomyces paludis]